MNLLTIWPSSPLTVMTPADRETLLVSAFQINYDNLLNRYPRFRELWEKSQKSGVATAAKAFTPQEIVDLQVLSQVGLVRRDFPCR